MNAFRRPLVLLFALVVAGSAAAACSVRVADADGSTPSTSPTSATSSAPVSSAPSPTGSENVRGFVDDERMAKLQRSRWTDAVTQHVVCVDGQHTVDSNADALVVEVTGDCREVTILASAAIVLLPALDELTIEGDGNVVIVSAAREIDLDAEADANLVGWETGTAIVKDAGTLNGTTPIS
ncbi:MAG: hypothetical protein DI577_02275 [Microbacterium sp.]|nr:MAG: hypothetical protein DI577_02275 [Microbacterium sp.]PZU37745.1 MAG: hypothetical protein DI575_02275 [Microbacterium sp.]